MQFGGMRPRPVFRSPGLPSWCILQLDVSGGVCVGCGEDRIECYNKAVDAIGRHQVMVKHWAFELKTYKWQTSDALSPVAHRRVLSLSRSRAIEARCLRPSKSSVEIIWSEDENGGCRELTVRCFLCTCFPPVTPGNTSMYIRITCSCSLMSRAFLDHWSYPHRVVGHAILH